MLAVLNRAVTFRWGFDCCCHWWLCLVDFCSDTFWPPSNDAFSVKRQPIDDD
jgi:hypothetical protein